jgi:hypothetical protein
MKEFLKLVIGTDDVPLYAAMWFFSLAGIAISLLIDAKGRDKESERTPPAWSWNFFWSDNFRRLITTVLLVFIALRFSNELLGVDISLWASFLIGLGFDKLAEVAKKKNILGGK